MSIVKNMSRWTMNAHRRMSGGGDELGLALCGAMTTTPTRGDTTTLHEAWVCPQPELYDEEEDEEDEDEVFGDDEEFADDEEYDEEDDDFLEDEDEELDDEESEDEEDEDDDEF